MTLPNDVIAILVYVSALYDVSTMMELPNNILRHITLIKQHVNVVKQNLKIPFRFQLT